MSELIYGIDVSSWQGDIDLAAMGGGIVGVVLMCLAIVAGENDDDDD